MPVQTSLCSLCFEDGEEVAVGWGKRQSICNTSLRPLLTTVTKGLPGILLRKPKSVPCVFTEYEGLVGHLLAPHALAFSSRGKFHQFSVPLFALFQDLAFLSVQSDRGETVSLSSGPGFERDFLLRCQVLCVPTTERRYIAVEGPICQVIW